MGHLMGKPGAREITPSLVVQFREIIYQYYAVHGRSMPWRSSRNPYHILVSEIMLQQTQVERVVPKYQQFISLFPDFFSLALAPLRDILAVWQAPGDLWVVPAARGGPAEVAVCRAANCRRSSTGWKRK